MSEPNSPVKRRHVLFFGGYDPKGASWYHAIYSREAAAQAAVNGMTMEVGPRRRDEDGRQYWIVESRDGKGGSTQSCIEVGAWDAVVRLHWPRDSVNLLLQMLRAYARMFRHGPGEILKVRRVAPRTAFALLLPLMLFCGVLVVTALLATALAATVGTLSGSTAAALMAAVCVVTLCAWAALRLESKLDTGLLARIYDFVGDWAIRGNAELEAVLRAASDRIEELRRSRTVDEILVVGFSVGSILAVRAVARALSHAEAASSDETPALSLLTLGHCIPLYGLYPQAGEFRTELARIAASNSLSWIDVSSPTDWGSFALLDPLGICEVEVTAKGSGAPRMYSPRFHTLFTPETYAGIIGDKQRMHMQYLMATELPGQYDYFAISAGPLPLALRFPAREGRHR